MTASSDSIFRCPVTHEPLHIADPDLLGQINARAVKGTVAGEAATGPEAVLVNRSHTYAYPVRDGIHMLLPTFALRLDDAAGGPAMRNEKEIVRNFYDKLGWQRDEEGKFDDTTRFVDVRDVSQTYLSNCHKRLSRYLPASGKYLLDAASGPIVHDEYLIYSENFEKRICVDLSHVALTEARRRIGEKGIFVVCDLTNLPIQDGVVDAAVSLHTIYHIPADEQRSAFDELHRVIKPGGRALIVYIFGSHAPLTWLAEAPFKGLRRLMALVTGRTRPSNVAYGQPLYFFPHPRRWFAAQRWPYELEILSWRSIGKDTLEFWIHERLLGRAILKVLFALESAFPRVFGRIGQYPLLIIHKKL